MANGWWRRPFATSAPGTTRPPACPRRAPQGLTPTNPVTDVDPTPDYENDRRRRPRIGGGLVPATGLLRPGLPRNRATSRALPGRMASAARLLAMGQSRQKTGKTCLLTPSARSGRMGPQ